MLSAKDLIKANWNCVHFEPLNNVTDVKAELNSYSQALIDVDFSHITSDNDLFSEISKVLKFPDYFGNNWDAFDECLSDMEWLPSSGYVLFSYGSDALWKNNPFIGGKLISAWLSAAEQWSHDNIPFHLVFVLSNTPATYDS